MDDELHAADTAYGKTLDPDVLAGYHYWAIPVANKMRESQLLTNVIKYPALAWARHIAGEKNLLGATILNVGLPICKLIGMLRRQQGVCHG
jgi:hypothetical protein